MSGDDARQPEPRAGRPAPPDPVGRAPVTKAVYACDLCGAEMLDLHCKLVCERCGYKRDCSDP